jgi:hypothetical protein
MALDDRVLRRLDVGPAFGDGLASRPHVGKDANGIGRRRVDLARHCAEGKAERLFRLAGFLILGDSQQPERGGRLIATYLAGKGLPFEYRSINAPRLSLLVFLIRRRSIR